jgi:voltage-gated potassium channel Kch
MRQDLQWYAILIAAILALVLAGVGFALHPEAHGGRDTVVNILVAVGRVMTFRYAEPAGVTPPLVLQIARILWLVVVMAGAGKAVFVAVRKDIRLAMAARRSGHVVVCGLGDKGEAFARALAKSGRKVVAVEIDPDAGSIARLQSKGHAVVIGDARDTDTLKRAGVGRAHAIVATCSSNGANIEVGLAARSVAEERGARRRAPLLASLEITRIDLHDQLHEYDDLIARSAYFDFRFFSPAGAVARRLLADSPIVPATDPKGARYVRLGLIGFGSTGQAVGLEAIRSCQFGAETELSVVAFDRHAEALKETFLARYPEIGQVCRVEFVAADAERYAAGDLEPLLAADGERPFTCFCVALGNDDTTISVTLALQRATASLDAGAPAIFTHLPNTTRIGEALRRAPGPTLRAGRLVEFGSLEPIVAKGDLMGEATDGLAREIHARYLENSTGTEPASGSASARKWAELPESYRAASRRQADHIPRILSELGYAVGPAANGSAITLDDDEIERAARAEHARWRAERILMGWRLGKATDPDKRIHPSLVPWPRLPDAAKAQTRDAMAALPALLDKVGLGMSRSQGNS